LPELRLGAYHAAKLFQQLKKIHEFVVLPDKTRQDQDKTRQDKTRQDKTGQDKTRQDKTRQDKTRQDKTRQDKTRQDRTSSSVVLWNVCAAVDTPLDSCVR
jgi:hypothetical protein